MTYDGANFKIDAYKEELDRINNEIKQLKKEKAALEQDVADNYAEQIASLLKEKDEPYGSVNIVHGEFTVKITKPKKVAYDQRLLSNVYYKIKEAGDNPDNYIKTKYSVSETSFKDWSDAIKGVFADSRTVGYGATKIEIVEND